MTVETVFILQHLTKEKKEKSLVSKPIFYFIFIIKLI